ncbi:sulfurtransferase TusA family protein [Desulfohalobiaceae bacterium Ax17]|jgi:TusA-related sulfurtransferase|uniref:sulfurtransferase TusA family protein n=1 Tax=Desulfovulcanus ferrireducens TaxID=2831190 RepID=UPI00207BB0A6|nr:sulfurtransferase TusA family protein [Desulfovulcanus ferrireducens]MBT8764501.1 sulfurtransferase TusA family protein [Desulfovulcanus ferrireducens]
MSERAKTIDARGLSCPQPVLLVMDAIKTTSSNELIVLVDTDTSRENVIRAAGSQGWQVKEIETENDEYKIILEK